MDPHLGHSECMTYDVCGAIGVFETLYYLQALATVSAHHSA